MSSTGCTLSQKSYPELLRQLMGQIQNFKELAPAPQVAPSTPLRCSPSPALDLPFPDDILVSIDALKLPQQISGTVRHIFMESINGSRRFVLQSYEQTCRDLSRSPFSSRTLETLPGLYQNLYKNHHLPQLREEVSRLQTIADVSRRESERKKRTFNTEYIPFLETYFEHNAYPSGSDRSVLALKSMMSPRQIEVWFQNHRNRAKKEGKSLTRLSSDLPLKHSLEKLETMPFFPITEGQRLSSPSELSSDEDSGCDGLHMSQHSTNVEVFTCTAPPHAFPTTYPPKCVDDPFPNEHGIFKFAPPIWKRSPASSRPESVPVNMDGFIIMFASKLNLREGLSSGHHKRKALSCGKEWFASMVTVLPPAPHPAFLRSSSLHSNSLPVRNAFKPIASSSSKSRSAPLTSPCQSSLCSRKLSPLPRQTPSSRPFASNADPPTPFHVSSPRTSSFSSTISSQSRSTSSSSLSSMRLVSPLLSPAIQSQTLSLGNDVFEVFNEYVTAKGQYQWNNSGCSGDMITKQVPLHSWHRPNFMLALSDSNLLATQS